MAYEEHHKHIPHAAFESLIVSREPGGLSVFKKFDLTRTNGGSQVLKSILVQKLSSKQAIIDRQHLLQKLLDANDDFDFELNNLDLRYLEAYLYSAQPIEHKNQGLITRLIRKIQIQSDTNLHAVSEAKRSILFLKTMFRFFSKRKSLENEIFNGVFAAWRVILQSDGLRSISDLDLSTIPSHVVLKADTKLRGEYQPLLKQSIDELYEFDALVALTKAIKKYDLVFPDLNTNRVSINACVNPLINNAIPFDFNCQQKLIFLTGPNMSGKSSCLRSIAICVLLAHSGMAVPAGNAGIPFFDEICVSINQSDDTASGFSHFYNEIIGLKKICDHIENGRLVFSISDEIFRGTNFHDAKDCASMLIERIISNDNYQFIFSSHFPQLLEHVDVNAIQFEQAEVLISEGVPQFTYQLKPGESDIQLGAFLFRKIGF